MAGNESGFGPYQSEDDLEAYKIIGASFPEFRDWDPTPRPVPFEVAGRLPIGHIAFQNNIERPEDL